MIEIDFMRNEYIFDKKIGSVISDSHDDEVKNAFHVAGFIFTPTPNRNRSLVLF
jgi:hypothetical protein